MSKAALWVGDDLHGRVKEAAAKRGESVGRFVDAALRPVCRRVVRGEEPLSKEAIAGLVSVVAKATGETPEACMDRLLSRAVLEDFANLAASPG
jgi:hypothetical protein